MSARLVVLASLATAALAMPIMENLHDRAYYEEKFFNWLSEHKIEATSGDHFVKMIQNFANNDDIITQHNNQNLSYTLGHNQFSHLSVEEYREYVKLGLNKPENIVADEIFEASPDTVNPTSKDWVALGAVTGVKDQGQCGSCWSFSATGAMEGAYKNAKGTLPSLSEQNFVDCDNRQHGGSDLGCNGGLMDSAFAWAKSNGGLCTEAAYPYTSGTTKKAGTCSQSCKESKYAPTGYTDVKKNDDLSMETALATHGPVSIAIEADESSFQLYKSGVFTGKCGANLDHGVLAVGYAKDYFLVKNSWGTSWGDKGYIKLARGSQYNGGQGQCGMLAGPPSYPKY